MDLESPENKKLLAEIGEQFAKDIKESQKEVERLQRERRLNEDDFKQKYFFHRA